jgi:zinc transport system permease protein
MRVFSSFKSVILCSAVFSVVCAFAGIVLSILAGTPVGATVVITDMLAFGAFYVIGSAKAKA